MLPVRDPAHGKLSQAGSTGGRIYQVLCEAPVDKPMKYIFVRVYINVAVVTCAKGILKKY